MREVVRALKREQKRLAGELKQVEKLLAGTGVATTGKAKRGKRKGGKPGPKKGSKKTAAPSKKGKPGPKPKAKPVATKDEISKGLDEVDEMKRRKAEKLRKQQEEE